MSHQARQEIYEHLKYVYNLVHDTPVDASTQQLEAYKTACAVRQRAPGLATEEEAQWFRQETTRQDDNGSCWLGKSFTLRVDVFAIIDALLNELMSTAEIDSTEKLEVDIRALKSRVKGSLDAMRMMIYLLEKVRATRST